MQTSNVAASYINSNLAILFLVSATLETYRTVPRFMPYKHSLGACAYVDMCDKVSISMNFSDALNQNPVTKVHQEVTVRLT